MRTGVLFVVVAALLTGCGGGSSSSTSSDASVPALITQSLKAARASPSVQFRVHMTGTVKLDTSRLDHAPLPRAQLEALAAHAFRIELAGARSDRLFTLAATVHESGHVHRFKVLQVDGRLLIAFGGAWYSGRGDGTIGSIFRSEQLGGLVPLEACIREGESEGCDRVDFGPALDRRHLGRLVKGTATRRAGATEISGTVDAGAFATFHAGVTPNRRDTRGIYLGALSTYRPYERNSHIDFVIGRGHLPRRFVFSYTLDRDALADHLRGEALTPVVRRAGRVEVDLSHWGESVRAQVPEHVRPLPVGRAQGILEGLERALLVFY
jgi:hypothetical protein